MPKKVVLLTARIFSSTGGIQKMARVLGHVLYNIAQKDNWDFKLYDAYDSDKDLMPKYLPKNNFKGFNHNKPAFTLSALQAASRANVVILSHINLAVVGLMIKRINPKCKVWLIAHGIEVWRPIGFLKRQLLKKCDELICVSNYTRQQMISIHGADAAKCSVLNNALDPFMPIPAKLEKPPHLLKRYGILPHEPVLYTLTRLASTEQYKGYEQVIKALANLKIKYPTIKYILSGQYDAVEKERIDKLIQQHNVAAHVILTGFVDESELTGHFLLADVFVLPSRKEGFGIVFIEAMACGLPVICGNADGSVDAIMNGELGTAVDVNKLDELEASIDAQLRNPLSADKRKQLQTKCVANFNENKYGLVLQKKLSAA